MSALNSWPVASPLLVSSQGPSALIVHVSVISGMNDNIYLAFFVFFFDPFRHRVEHFVFHNSTNHELTIAICVLKVSSRLKMLAVAYKYFVILRKSSQDPTTLNKHNLYFYYGSVLN